MSRRGRVRKKAAPLFLFLEFRCAFLVVTVTAAGFDATAGCRSGLILDDSV